MCGERQLSKHGKKAELVARLQHDDEANEDRFIADDDEKDDDGKNGGARERAPAGSPQVKRVFVLSNNCVTTRTKQHLFFSKYWKGLI